MHVGLTKGRLNSIKRRKLYTRFKLYYHRLGEVDSYSKRMVGLDVFGYRSLKQFKIFID